MFDDERPTFDTDTNDGDDDLNYSVFNKEDQEQDMQDNEVGMGEDAGYEEEKENSDEDDGVEVVRNVNNGTPGGMSPEFCLLVSDTERSGH
ncbi:hypothetical protein Hanom_Chr03g00247081 [Helianthus anomalus]